MTEQITEKSHHLEILAEEDPVFQIWKNCYGSFSQAFTEYADAQPKEIRDFLYGYAESGRLMQQRMVNIACEHMVFPE